MRDDCAVSESLSLHLSLTARSVFAPKWKKSVAFIAVCCHALWARVTLLLHSDSLFAYYISMEKMVGHTIYLFYFASPPRTYSHIWMKWMWFAVMKTLSHLCHVPTFCGTKNFNFVICRFSSTRIHTHVLIVTTAYTVHRTRVHMMKPESHCDRS